MKSFYKRHETTIKYFLFGIVPVVISFGVYNGLIELFTLTNAVDQHSGALTVTFAKTVSWFAAAVSAYFTNMFFVFKRRPPTTRAMIAQLASHTGARFGTFLLSLGITLSTKYLFQMWDNSANFLISPDNIAWFVGSVFEVFINYFIAKIIIFRKKPIIKEEKDYEMPDL